jgi:diaminopimelate decarboxylase
MASNAQDLVKQFGSPLYVYDVEAVRMAYRTFETAFPYAQKTSHYAIVCNKNPHLVRALAALGAGVHANTPGDAFAALVAGLPADQIVYSGTNLDAADLDFLLTRAIRANLDSLDQLRAWLVARAAHPGAHAGVGLRLAVDDPQVANRIGVAPEDVPAAVQLAQAVGVRIEGLHMYAGTNTRRPDRFVACFDAVIAASAHLPDLAYLDLGGGYGVAYREGHAPLDLPALGAAITQRMEALSAARGRPIQLLLEPGRLLVAQAGTLYTRVVSVKERGGRRFHRGLGPELHRPRRVREEGARVRRRSSRLPRRPGMGLQAADGDWEGPGWFVAALRATKPGGRMQKARVEARHVGLASAGVLA